MQTPSVYTKRISSKIYFEVALLAFAREPTSSRIKTDILIFRNSEPLLTHRRQRGLIVFKLLACLNVRICFG